LDKATHPQRRWQRTAQMAMLRNVKKPDVEAVQLFRAALCQDIAQIKQIAFDYDTNATAF
jgi:hypothetical protein